jgi:serine/threonine protein kinase/formylglycine-generating enzyme required for sulfatase activity
MSIDDDKTLLDGSAPEKAHGAVLKAGDRLGDYVLMQLLGAGAMGQVYLAKQVHLGQQCAVKVLPEELSRSADFKRRFAGEGRALAKVDHRYVVRVLYAGEDSGRFYTVLEYVNGGDLSQYLHSKGGKLDEGEARVVLEEILEGLACAHKKGIVHRDLKPANILRTAEGEFKISDFGLALVMNNEAVQDRIRRSVVAEGKQVDPDATVVAGGAAPISGTAPWDDKTLVAGVSKDPDATVVAPLGRADDECMLVASSRKASAPEQAPEDSGMASASAFVGTLDYMSPEVRAGQAADTRSDIYAVGIIAYQMLTGRKPLGRAKAVSVLAPEIAPEWDAWVDKCLEIEPKDRFASATEALEALAAVPRKAPTLSPEVTPAPRKSPGYSAPAAVVQTPFPVKKPEAAKAAGPDTRRNSNLVFFIIVGAVVALLWLAIGSYFLFFRKSPEGEKSEKPRAAEKTAPAAVSPTGAKPSSSAPSSAKPTQPVLKTGRIAFPGESAGVLVSLDGGKPSPVVSILNDVAEGKHLLRFSRDGYDFQDVTVKVRAGDIAEVKVPALKRQTGSIAIASRPTSLDWRMLSAPADATSLAREGKTPFTLSGAPTGRYEVEFVLAGFEPKRAAVKVEKGVAAKADVVFPGGPVSVKSSVANAVVRDAYGTELGRTPLEWAYMPVGDYTFHVSAEGYGRATVRGSLEDGGSLALFAYLEKASVPEQGRAAGVLFPNGILMPLEWIRPGDFRMGSNSGEVGREKNERPHNVRITNGFWLARYEVTQSQWEALMGENPSGFASAGPDAPVERVSWNDAVEFCRKLTEMARKNGVLPDGYVYALPTEAEWEYACRAGSMGAYSGGIDDMGWTAADSGRTTHPVGRKASNAFGLHDIYGNVAEWCADWYGDYDLSQTVDPQGPSDGKFRVARGGSWKQAPGKCRSASRNSFVPTDRWDNVGLRVALVRER